MKVMPRNARNILRVRGANVISKTDRDAISRGKRCEHHDDLHARSEPAGNRSAQSTGLVDILLRDRHSAAYAEGAAGDFESGCGLFAFVFVQINPALDPADRFLVKPAGADVARA